jgi:Na+/melibiose symporter-like transporter
LQKLKSSTLFYYSLTDMPVMMSIFPVMVFIPRFYASDVGVSLAAVGTYIFIMRVMDVFTDPLMGYISDHTRSRFGRRRPWVALSTPIMMLAIYKLFMPPADADGLYMFVWLVTLSVATTMMLIPYYAWGAELSTDYNERSKVTGWRAGAGVMGQLTAQLVPALALFFFGLGGSATVLELVGAAMLVTMPICVLVTLAKTPEPQQHIKSVIPMMQGIKLMFTNGPFLRLVMAFMIGSIGLNITTPLYIFFVADVLGAEDQSIYMLSCFYITNLATIPFWVWLSGKMGKHRAYLMSFIIIACAHPFYLLLGEGDFWWMLPVTIATGFAAAGFSQAIPNSMKADVIDLDTLESGENRAALFFSAWSFAQKATASIGGAIAMFGLALWGFDAAPGAVNGETEMFGLRFLFSTFPSIFFLTAAAIVWKYPITEARHAEIRAALAARA